MTARTVDKCLDEISRLRMQNTATQGHLYAAEYLLHQVAKLLPHMIADSAVSGAYRDALLTDITDLLAEDREHPGAAVTDVRLGEGDTSVTATEVTD